MIHRLIGKLSPNAPFQNRDRTKLASVERAERQLEERVFRCQQTSQSIVVSDSSRNDTEGTSSDLSGCASIVLGDCEKNKGNEEANEQRQERD